MILNYLIQDELRSIIRYKFMIKKLFVKIILCGLCVLLTASLIMLLIGSICDDYSDNSDISDFCDENIEEID